MILAARLVRQVQVSESDGSACTICAQSLDYECLPQHDPHAEEDRMELSEARNQAKAFLPELTETGDNLNHSAAEPDRVQRQTGEPGPVLLVGPPGVGKGTQAETLAKLWGVPPISTGEILRTNVANGSELGVQANRIMKLGGLVPDPIMTEMVANRLGLSDTAAGFILDGFPRTVGQAQWLDEYLGAHRRGSQLAIISMSMDYRRIAERVIHRRVCPLCKTVYNIHFMPPKRTGRCDRDGSELQSRTDDGVEVFQTRLEVFRRETEPLIHYYRGHVLFIEIDADNPPSMVTENIVTILKGLRRQIGR